MPAAWFSFLQDRKKGNDLNTAKQQIKMLHFGTIQQKI